MVNIDNKSLSKNDVYKMDKFRNKTLQDYEVISVIGSGSFGTCFKVRDKQSGELFAWKGIDYDELSESSKESLVSEINLLSQLQHPNIVQYYHHLVNHEAKSIFIVMECCEGGDLAQLISKACIERKRFEEQYIWRVLFQVCKAVQVCHNKIERGTILHRDIKPANIFLDAKGNAKLGDFGLARMLRRYESFAQSFVGTPHYMSPELVKGTKYDRKSDVWAVGCLIYEMCALRPPFKGRQFDQLSANISNGKFSCIPVAFSADLQEIISFMLEVENDHRPSIEMVTRHPVLIRNIKNINSEFPKLVDNKDTTAEDLTTNLELWTDLSSTVLTEHNSFNEEYGQRRLSFSGVFTPDLRTELFYSAKRRIFNRSHLQQSDPELYESIKREYNTIVHEFPETSIQKVPASDVKSSHQTECSPRILSQNIFDHVLQERLHAIRAQECLLKQREAALDKREQQINDREVRLQELERNLQKREYEKKNYNKSTEIKPNSIAAYNCLGLPVVKSAQPPPPQIPPRKIVQQNHDETYCTIEPNDTMLQPPTVAKLNLATLPSSKATSTLRKVTFQSPKKFITYDIENLPLAAPNKAVSNPSQSANSTQMQASVSSSGSDRSSSTQRRKSILSIFGLSRSSNKESNSKVTPIVQDVLIVKKERQPFSLQPTNVLSKCEPNELNNIWTKEHKRAAFDLLAAMNAAKRDGESMRFSTRHKMRQSVRERNTFQRNRLRRTLTVAPLPTDTLGGDRLIV